MTDDLAILWSLRNGVICSLARVPAGWRVRVEDQGLTLQCHECLDGNEAVDVGQAWERDWRARRSVAGPPAPRRVW
jgi:hypothetical protein